MKELTLQEKNGVIENLFNLAYYEYVERELRNKREHLVEGKGNYTQEKKLYYSQSFCSKSSNMGYGGSDHGDNTITNGEEIKNNLRFESNFSGDLVYYKGEELHKELKGLLSNIEKIKKRDYHRPLANALNDFVTDFNKVMKEFGREDLEIMNLKEFQKVMGFKPVKEISKENGLRKAIQEL
ncbi:MAG: hypothetical protein FWE47_04035 [Oscillospiraceae bacterium]|nr:hypothetical protein [Oscillospiraceae bacterium]